VDDANVRGFRRAIGRVGKVIVESDQIGIPIIRLAPMRQPG
jgi:hypothetical protein